VTSIIVNLNHVFFGIYNPYANRPFPSTDNDDIETLETTALEDQIK